MRSRPCFRGTSSAARPLLRTFSPKGSGATIVVKGLMRVSAEGGAQSTAGRVLAHKSGTVFDLQFSPVVVFRDWRGRFRALWRENRARAQYVGREERFFFTLRRVR